MHAIWVHGNSAVAQFVGGMNFTSPGTAGHENTQANSQNWTDIVGLPTSGGKVFRCQRQTTNTYHFSIPTPVILNDRRLRVERVYVLFRSDADVSVTRVSVFDGPRMIDDSPMAAGVSGRHDGTATFADIHPGITLHVVEARPEVIFGIGISVEVRFSQEGNITFTTAGVDFS